LIPFLSLVFFYQTGWKWWQRWWKELWDHSSYWFSEIYQIKEKWYVFYWFL